MEMVAHLVCTPQVAFLVVLQKKNLKKCCIYINNKFQTANLSIS